MFRSPVLDDIRSNIHSKPIPWKGLNRANVVSEDVGSSFESLRKLNNNERQDRVRSEVDKYTTLVIQLLSEDIRDDIVRYILLFVIEYGERIPEFAQALAKEPKTLPLFNSLLERNDELIAYLAAVATSIIATAGVTAPINMIESLYRFTIQHLLLTTNSDVNYKDLGAQILDVLLQNATYRAAFRSYESEAIPATLALVASAPLQVQYTSLLVLWILSFDGPSGKRFVTDFSVVSVVLDTAKAALKEKIVRVSLAIIANLLRFDAKHAVPVLIAEGALGTTKVLSTRKWNDEELSEDLEFIQTQLTEAFECMTTFEEYEAELSVGRLRWTPVHKNKAFWIENIGSFKEHDWAVLRQILDLIKSTDDSTTLAVACHDVAAIVEQAPDASKVVTSTGGKVRLMELISNQDTEVRFEALKATQRMLTHIFA